MLLYLVQISIDKNMYTIGASFALISLLYRNTAIPSTRLTFLIETHESIRFPIHHCPFSTSSYLFPQLSLGQNTPIRLFERDKTRRRIAKVTKATKMVQLRHVLTGGSIGGIIPPRRNFSCSLRQRFLQRSIGKALLRSTRSKMTRDRPIYRLNIYHYVDLKYSTGILRSSYASQKSPPLPIRKSECLGKYLQYTSRQQSGQVSSRK